MAKPYLKRGTWYVRVKDVLGWRSIAVPEARTKAEANRHAADLAMRLRRQRDGLEPLPGDRSLTLGKLLEWWLENYSARMPSHRRTEGRYRAHFRGSELARLPLAALTSGRIEVFLQSKADALSCASLNHLRGFIRTAFNAGRRAGLCSGPNPAADVRKRKVAKRKPAFLEAREVAPVLARIAARWRPLFATAIYTGLRKGELLGLRKKDVDLQRRLLTVGRSYARNTTKGGHEDAIPVARELVPYLEQAMRTSPSGLLFARADGSMWSEHAPLGEKLRSAMGRAGFVECYRHVCRRCKAGRKPDCEERHPDDALRRCKACNMKLMACPVPRRLRFHDLRHHADVLIMPILSPRIAAGAETTQPPRAGEVGIIR